MEKKSNKKTKAAKKITDAAAVTAFDQDNQSPAAEDATSEAGASEADVREEPAETGAKEPEKAGDILENKLRKKMQPYFDNHPKVDMFFVTSDDQPFYEMQWAKEHQKTLDASKPVTTVNR
jgi:hypothetical protein